jgi:hypothetical protein
MKAPSIESMNLKLEDSRLMADGIREYIYVLEGLNKGEFLDDPFFNIIANSIKHDNKNYGTLNNSELYTNLAYLRGMLDVYEKQVEHLSELFGEGTNE